VRRQLRRASPTGYRYGAKLDARSAKLDQHGGMLKEILRRLPAAA
jgi:hypothetical protein